jgi:3-dehydroquinate synthase
MAEVVKYGAIRDRLFFVWLEDHADEIIGRSREALEHLIYRSVLNKAEIVAKDEREAGERALLNFGHSFGHALEAETRYSKFLHGEAVAIGMVTAARLSASRGLCSQGITDRISALLTRFGLPVNIPAQSSLDGMRDALDLDKKALASGLRLILLTDIGRAIINDDSHPDEIISVMMQSLDQDRTSTKE